MAILTREQILDAKDYVTETVAVPEWGGEVIVRGLDSKHRGLYQKALYTIDNRGNLKSFNNEVSQATLIAYSVVDENGKQAFQPGDIEALGRKSAQAMERVFKVAQKLSGLGEHEEAEIEKN